ncbi:MAG TPA: lipocalin-like domain-containing protein [Thermoanaerobaculia bacterium]|nr:lipocalin-like domain-containing protein [Thermoanaerobaculia bacterium]
MKHRLFVLALMVAIPFVPHSASAQFKPALPGYQFEFPRDHGSHEDFRTEWWYYTGHLEAESGRRYGFEVTFFRVGVARPETAPETRWDLRDLALAHFAITDVSGRRFRYYEKLNRMSPFTAGAATGHLEVFNEGWRAQTSPDGSWNLRAASDGDAIDLKLRAAKPPVVHGEDGVSVKAQGTGYASHYYSMTRLLATGTLAVKGRKPERVTGLAWMDHEFGGTELRENQQGWDWFSLQLDNETELMLYIIRRVDGTPDVTSSGSLVTDAGDVIRIRHDQIRVTPESTWRSPRSGANYPMGWTLEVPSLKIRLRLVPVLEDQELVTRASTQVTYWEGAVDVSGSLGNISVRGAGYVEMTGYDRPFRQR